MDGHENNGTVGFEEIFGATKKLGRQINVRNVLLRRVWNFHSFQLRHDKGTKSVVRSGDHNAAVIL